MIARTMTFVAVLLAASGSALAGPPAVTAAGAWCRAAPVGAPSGGCYVTLTSGLDDRLLAIETPAAERGEIHTMSMDGGVMRMRRLSDGLALPAGKPVALRPGAEHLMLIGPKQPLAAGGTVTLTLRFAKAPPLPVTAPVLASPGPAAAATHGRDRR